MIRHRCGQWIQILDLAEGFMKHSRFTFRGERYVAKWIASECAVIREESVFGFCGVLVLAVP